MKTVKLATFGLLAAASAFAQKPIKVVTTASLNATGPTAFVKDTVYHLQGPVYVGQSAAQPQQLSIQAGTVIKGLPGELGNASVLIITKWGEIHANGTAAEPILFTTVYDNENDPNDLGAFDRGMWGGVIILGNAPISEGTAFIEGIPAEPRAEYGGSDPTDNSGVFRYVSIRHGGKLIGGANEINGLTMGGVGSGTTIDHVEVFANNDDGFEWFGGTVNAKYLVSAYGNDDAFDFDFGYKGKLQYAFAIYHNGNTDPNGNQAIEGDGFSMPQVVGVTDTSKYSNPMWSNLTLIGSGNPQAVSPANDFAFRLRDGTAGDFKNMVLQDWRSNAGRFDVQGGICDAMCQFGRDSLNIEGSVFWNFGNFIGSLSNLFTGVGLADSIVAKNIYANPGLHGTGWLYDSVDVRPAPGGPAYTVTHYQMNDPFFDAVTYAGAFGAENWMEGWTAMSHTGIAKSHLRVQPAAGNEIRAAKLHPTAGWDFVLTQTYNAPLNINASTAFLNGSDVSATFRTGIWPGGVFNPATGHRIYRANGQSGAIFGGPGKKNLRLRMVTQTGMVLEDTFYWDTTP